MTEDRIRHMVDRFLCWKLPENFNPDGGISFKKTINEHTPYRLTNEPSGTNLFDATQAEAMVRHMVADLADAVRQERGELAYLFQMQAIDHDSLAEESARNEEHEDEQAHKFEASVWRTAAAMVSNRGKPAAAESAEIPEDDIKF